jgi:hypothetical protein
VPALRRHSSGVGEDLQPVRPEELDPGHVKDQLSVPAPINRVPDRCPGPCCGGHVQFSADTDDEGAGMSAVLVVQIELSVRHGRSFTTRLRLGIGRHCRPPPARGGQILLPEHTPPGSSPEQGPNLRKGRDEGLPPAVPQGTPRQSRTARTDDRRNLP